MPGNSQIAAVELKVVQIRTSKNWQKSGFPLLSELHIFYDIDENDSIRIQATKKPFFKNAR